MPRKQTLQAVDQPVKAPKTNEDYLLRSAFFLNLAMVRRMCPMTWDALSPQTRKAALDYEKKVILMNKETKKEETPLAIDDGASLLPEIALIHSRIEQLLTRKSQDGGPSDDDWNQLLQLSTHKVRLIEAENQRRLVEQNALLHATLEDLKNFVTKRENGDAETKGKPSRRRQKTS